MFLRGHFKILIVLHAILIANSRRKLNVAETKIVGGVETTIGQVPYLVNLRINGQFSCGGSLITSKCVLSAAHCVHRIAPSELTITAGVSRLSEAGELRQVVEHFTSPLYSPLTLDMDVAILKLTDGLSVNRNIATISLCSKRPADKQSVKVSGWGITNENYRVPPDQVRTVDVQVIPKMECSMAYADRVRLTSTMFCAAVPGLKDSCSGDSGGPVVYNGQVCGIVSWGIGCARTDSPGVYTDVSSLRVNAFIKRIVKQNCL